MEGDDRPGVSATLMLDQRRVAEELLGPEVIAQAIARLSPADREAIEELLPGSFLPVEIGQAFHRAIAEVIGRDFEDWHREVIRAGTERTFSTVWRVFLRFTSLGEIVKRAAAMYRKTYDHGTMSARVLESGGVEAVVTGWYGMPRIEAQGLAAGIESVLHLSGRPQATVSFRMTADGAHFAISGGGS
jgi:hypothetical protein